MTKPRGDDTPPYFERRFLVDIEPIRTTHQADLRILKTKDGRQFIGKTDKSEVKVWCEKFALLAKRHAPDVPFEGPLEVSLYFAFPNIKSDKGKVMPMTTKPDFDNLAKAVCDTLTKCGFWTDDSQIVFGKVLKFRSPNPFLGVHICPARWVDEQYADAVRTSLSS